MYQSYDISLIDTVIISDRHCWPVDQEGEAATGRSEGLGQSGRSTASQTGKEPGPSVFTKLSLAWSTSSKQM